MSNSLTAVRSLASQLLVTDVYQDDDSYLWLHSVGTNAPLPFTTIPQPLRNHADLDPLVALGTGTQDRREYRTSGHTLVLDLIVGNHTQALHQTGALWAQALNHLHNAPLDPSLGVVLPRTALRAQSWLDGTWKPAADALGTGLNTIHAWLTDLAQEDVLQPVHGYPGMAHWITTPEGARGELLTGEDLGQLNPRYDIAWVLGECAELRHFYPDYARSLDVVEEQFLAASTTQPTTADRTVGVAFRLAQHAFDWHYYGGATASQATLLLNLAQQFLSK